MKEDGDNNLDKSSGQIIKSLCDKVGITKSELARRLGISPSQISRIINEETKTISSEILIALAKEFHVSADYILGLTDEKHTDKNKYDNIYNGVCKTSTTRVPMLLMISSFPLGGCLEFVESIEDIPQREVAYAEYYYFCGQHEKSVEYAGKYINHEDIMLKLSANLLYTFANLSLGRINSARLSLDQLQNCLKKDYPGYYERIIDITYRFSAGWRRIHNTDANEDVADNLTTTEFTCVA